MQHILEIPSGELGFVKPAANIRIISGVTKRTIKNRANISFALYIKNVNYFFLGF